MSYFKSWLKKERRLNYLMNPQVLKSYPGRKISERARNHVREQQPMIDLEQSTILIETMIGMTSMKMILVKPEK